jgi:predicted signal transduction protein with EAL and GGDEF domain
LAIAATRLDDMGVTASIGVASLPGDGVTSEELLDASDRALAEAYTAGGDSAVMASSLSAETQSHLRRIVGE